MIVDITIGYEMYSLMDGFFGYNQIKIAPEDHEKIAFTCAWGNFYWNVMSFGWCYILEGCHYNFP